MKANFPIARFSELETPFYFYDANLLRETLDKIKEEAGLAAQNLDTGFRVLKCDTSNMKDVYYNPAEYEVNMFSRLEDNIKEDRTPEDLLFQVMLDLGVLLSGSAQGCSVMRRIVFCI